MIFQATDDGGLTNIFKELNSVKTTFEELDKTTLSGAINAFNNTSVSVDDLSESFGGLDDSVVTYLNSTERGQASIDGLSNSMYNSASSMSFAATKAKLLAGALNMITGIAITLAIQGIVWAIDELIVTMDEQKEKLDDAIQAYEESETELKNINDELKTTQERIDELNAKDNLTFTEQDELEKLVKTNDELERKIFLLEQANKEAEKKVVAEVQDTYDKYTKNRNIGAADQIDFYTNSSLLEGVSWDTYKNDLSWLIAQYKKQEEILSNAQANGWDDIEENARNNLELLEGYMSEASQDYQDLYDKIGGISEYAMTDELKDAQQDLNNILDITAEILGYGGERAEISFDDIWNSEDFSSYKIELENLAKEGKLDATYVDNEKMYFTQYEESEIARWLLKKDGYNWFRFEQDGYNDIWYNVMFNMTPHQINGRTVGFDLVVESDCGYGFGAEEEMYFKEHEETVNSSTPLYLYINSDIDTYVYPEITITGCSGDFYIYNESDAMQTLSNNKQSDFKNISDNIFMDSENDIITGIDTAPDFNWKFIRLVKGVNVLKTNSTNDIKVNIKYREPRRVIV